MKTPQYFRHIFLTFSYPPGPITQEKNHLRKVILKVSIFCKWSYWSHRLIWMYLINCGDKDNLNEWIATLHSATSTFSLWRCSDRRCELNCQLIESKEDDIILFVAIYVEVDVVLVIIKLTQTYSLQNQNWNVWHSCPYSNLHIWFLDCLEILSQRFVKSNTRFHKRL